METWFEWFDNLPVVEKSKINWPLTLDFEVQGNFLVRDIKNILDKIRTNDDVQLLYTSQHCFNLLSWIRQMGIMGFSGLAGAVGDLLEKEFGNKNIIEDLQRDSLSRWLTNKDGQHKIGENYYNIHQGLIYYRNFRDNWHRIEPKEVFNITPTLGVQPDKVTLATLEKAYKPTPYHQIYSEWRAANFSGTLSEHWFTSQEGETTPEKVFEIAASKIKEIIDDPISYEQINELQEKGSDYLENLIKIGYIMLRFAQQRRQSGEHTVYLLRDCVIFHELQKTLDLIEGRETSSDQLLIGRKVLSNDRREGGYWYLTQEVLFHAYQRHPDDITKFYANYSRMIKEYAEYNPKFDSFLKELAGYIGEHITNAIDQHLKISIIDLGFQGSINILVKYIIDNYCVLKEKPDVDIHMYILAEWFKTVYRHRYTSETYSLLTHIEALARNEYLYDYKNGSFRDGKLLVTMGKQSGQRDADVELLALTMIAIVSKRINLL